MKQVPYVLLCLILAVPAARGQGGAATFNGTVLDPTDAVVSGAVVVATNLDTKLESKTTTTSAGAYTLPYLQAGTYTIRVSALGFRDAATETVALRAAQTLTVNIHLEVGQIGEAVMVKATPPLLETGTAEMGQYLNENEFKSWPILVDDGHRQIQTFIFSSLPGTTGGTFQGSINGGQQYSHEILFEGITIGRADLIGGSNNEMGPSMDAIGDFKLQTGAISAAYNGGQTAVANFSIKSGTNQLHGSSFYYFRNEGLDSASLGETTLGMEKAPYRENNYGFSVGGPVRLPRIYDGRNRTFFFASYEHDYVTTLGTSGFATLAPNEYRTGDFSKLLQPAWTGVPSSGTAIGTDSLGRPVVFGQIYDPLSTRAAPDAMPVRDPFPGNIIPQTRIDPVASNILGVGLTAPMYDTMVRNMPALANGPYFHEYILGIKVDQVISSRHHFSAFYNHSYRDMLSGGNYLPAPGPPTSTWTDRSLPSRTGRASLNSTLTPTLLNRLAAGYNRMGIQDGATSATQDQGWADRIGIHNTSPSVFPYFSFGGQDYQGGSIVPIGTWGYAFVANGSWVVMDDVTKIQGGHTFHFGYQYTRYYYNERAPSGSGHFNFSPRQTDLPGFSDQTGNAFASFLLGAVNSADNNVSGLSDGFRMPYHALYIQDDYKVTPKLTLNLGLRWEIITPFYERTDRMSYIDLSAPNPAAGNLPGVLVFRNRPSNTYWREFGPRLGVAYQLSSRIVIRTGYAMMNTPPIANSWGFGGFTTGYNATINVPQGTASTGFVDDPVLYLHEPFPSLGYTLPDTNPANSNFNANTTTAPDANRPGYTQNWNFSLQYLLPKQTVFEAAYVGNKGTRLWGFNSLDALPSRLLSRGDNLLDQVSNHPEVIPYAGFPTNLSIAQALLPYPQFYSVLEARPYNSNSNYNSLQVTVTKHLTSRLGFLVAYTWSKTIGYQDSNGPMGYGTPQDWFNRGLERSVASFNYPHSLKLTWSYMLPVGRGQKLDLHWMNYILGGWQASGIHNYMSGGPISVLQGGLTPVPGFGTVRPDVTGQPLSLGGVPSSADYSMPTQWFNPAAFAPVPTTGSGVPLRVGTAPRNLDRLTNPRSMSESLRATKAFPLHGDRLLFRIGATWANPFKRKYAYVVDTTVGDSAFGQVLEDGANRTLQLDARIEF